MTLDEFLTPPNPNVFRFASIDKGKKRFAVKLMSDYLTVFGYGETTAEAIEAALAEFSRQ